MTDIETFLFLLVLSVCLLFLEDVSNYRWIATPFGPAEVHIFTVLFPTREYKEKVISRVPHSLILWNFCSFLMFFVFQVHYTYARPSDFASFNVGAWLSLIRGKECSGSFPSKAKSALTSRAHSWNTVFCCGQTRSGRLPPLTETQRGGGGEGCGGGGGRSRGRTRFQEQRSVVFFLLTL